MWYNAKCNQIHKYFLLRLLLRVLYSNSTIFMTALSFIRLILNTCCCFVKKTFLFEKWIIQKQPSRGVFWKRCSENRRTPMRKCDSIKLFTTLLKSHFGMGVRNPMVSTWVFSMTEITLQHGCSPINFRTSFFKNTSGWLLLILHGSNAPIVVRTKHSGEIANWV